MTESLSETAKISLGKEASSLDVSPQFEAYSGVEIIVDEDTSYFAGNQNGRVLTIPNEWGTQAQANAILADLQAKGFQYQPYTADGAILNPAAEIGDGVTISDTYSGIYTISKKFGKLMKADISAPQDEEVDHEFPYEPKQDRIYKREISEARASIAINASSIVAEVQRASAAEGNLSSRITQTANGLTAEISNRKSADTNLSSRITATANSITTEVNRATAAEGTLRSSITQNANSITAKVDKTGGSSSSFAWELSASSWLLKSNGSTVFKVDRNGAEVKGKITATSGVIGGFTIGSSSLYNGMNNINSTASGVYVGTDGISVGGGKFKVTSGGNVSAENMTLTGTLMIGGYPMSADDLRLGAARANSGYNGWNNAYNWTSNNGGYCTGGVGNWYNAQTTSSSVSYFKCTTLSAGSVSCSNLFGANLNGCTIQISGGSYNIYRRYNSSFGHWVLTTD